MSKWVITTGEDDEFVNELVARAIERSEPVCHNCKHWSHDRLENGELVYFDGSYGACSKAGGGCDHAAGAAMFARYDGGYRGEFVTHASYGCNQFESKG